MYSGNRCRKHHEGGNELNISKRNKNSILVFILLVLLSIFISNIVSAQRVSDYSVENFAKKIITLGIKRGDKINYYTDLAKLSATNRYWMSYNPKDRDSLCRIVFDVDDEGYVDEITVYGSNVGDISRKNVITQAIACLEVLGLSPDEIMYLSDNMETYYSMQGEVYTTKSMWANSFKRKINVAYLATNDRKFVAFIDSKERTNNVNVP